MSLISDQAEPELIQEGAEWIEIHPRVSRIHLLKVPSFALLADRVISKCQGQFDLVHGFGFSLKHPHAINSSQFVHAAWGRSAAHRKNRGWNAKTVYQRCYTRLNERWERIAYSKAGRVIACSAQVRQDLISIGVIESRIRVIPNGVDVGEFSPGYVDRRSLCLPEGVPLALFVGDIRTSRKNLDAVLRGLLLRPTTHLAVVGSVYGSSYPLLAKSLGLEERVHFLDFRADISDLMRTADVFVFPSLYEPFGLVVLEALASGLPVITAKTVGAAEIVSEGGGIVVDNGGDENQLAEAMSQILDDPARSRSMRRAARLSAENYSWERVASEYMEEYERVLREGRNDKNGGPVQRWLVR